MMTPGPPSAVSAARGLDRLPAGADEGGLQHQIFRRITGDEKLGLDEQMRALAGSIGARLTRLGKIAGDIADRRVELADGDAKDIRKSVFLCHVII